MGEALFFSTPPKKAMIHGYYCFLDHLYDTKVSSSLLCGSQLTIEIMQTVHGFQNPGIYFKLALRQQLGNILSTCISCP